MKRNMQLGHWLPVVARVRGHEGRVPTGVAVAAVARTRPPVRSEFHAFLNPPSRLRQQSPLLAHLMVRKERFRNH